MRTMFRGNIRVFLLSVLFVALVTSFTSCAFAPQNLENLLRAPALGSGQGEIQEALTLYLSGEEPQYKYPKEGEWRSPLIQADLNGDGVEEGVLLYSLVNSTTANKEKGNNVYIAVLEQKDGVWFVQADLDSQAAEVASFEVVDLLGDNTRQLIVGYASANLTAKTFVLYQYIDGTLTTIHRKSYSRYELGDFTGRGGTDLVLVSPVEQLDGLQFQYLPVKNGQFLEPQAPVKLDSNFASCAGIYPSLSNEGEQVLVVDGVLETKMLASQLVYFSGEHFFVTDDAGKMRGESGRLNPILKAKDIDDDGIVEIPRRVGKYEIRTINNDKHLEYVEWVDFTGPEPISKEFGLLDTDRGVFVGLPADWQGRISVTDGKEKGEWVVQNAQTLDTLLQLRFYGEEDLPPRNSVLVPGTSSVYIVPSSSVTAEERLFIEAFLLV